MVKREWQDGVIEVCCGRLCQGGPLLGSWLTCSPQSRQPDHVAQKNRLQTIQPIIDDNNYTKQVQKCEH